MSKPAFYSVLDLGLRDVGVKNEPRRLATHFGKLAIPLLTLLVLFLIGACAILRRAGAEPGMLAAFVLAWTVAVLAMIVRSVTRAPVAVVKVGASGRNHLTWFVIVHVGLVAVAAVLLRELLMVPLIVVSLMTAALLWRARGRLPELVRRLQALLAADETVLGDGIGVAQGARGQDALRLVVATDRRLLVAGPKEQFVVFDAPYPDVRQYGIEWKQRGRLGVLTLMLAGHDPHVITAMAPANLLSIVRALEVHGVRSDDPEATAGAEREWERALRRSRSAGQGLIDRAAMSTRSFDRGVWLLLGLAAAAFYLNPFGIGLGASRDAMPLLLAVPLLCAACGYVSATSSSFTYLAPLNLLIVPAFFFADAGDVLGWMVVLSALGTVGLWAGSALRGAAGDAEPSEGGRAARGSLQEVLSGRGLVRLSTMMLAAMVALVASASAAGFELTNVRLALEQATLEQLPVDGRSNLAGGAALLTYTPGRDLHEFITDEVPLAGPYDGARWELRSSFTKGYNVLTLGHYIVEPRLDDPVAVAKFVAEKDRAHARLAGFPVTHTTRVVDGRRGYVWNHDSRGGDWYFSAWFPEPVHSVRVECIAREQVGRFKRLCGEAMRSLAFR